MNRRDAVRRRIGLVFQDPTLDGHLTAEQNLRLHAELYGIERRAVAARIERMLALVDLAAIAAQTRAAMRLAAQEPALWRRLAQTVATTHNLADIEQLPADRRPQSVASQAGIDWASIGVDSDCAPSP